MRKTNEMPMTTTVAAESHDSVDDDTKSPSITRLQDVHGQLISIIKWRGLKPKANRYAALLRRPRSQAAIVLTGQVFGEFAHWQRASGRVRKLRAKSGQPYHEAVERFVGDLLLAKVTPTAVDASTTHSERPSSTMSL